MSWVVRQQRAQAAVFATLGIGADWFAGGNAPAVPVRIILRDEDNVLGMTVADQIIIRVRQLDVADPMDNDIVQLEDERRYRLFGTQLLDRKKVWHCEAKVEDAPPIIVSGALDFSNAANSGLLATVI